MKGVYILLFKIRMDFSKCVGSLGRIQFERGNYAYIGSAQSSLFPRLERHFKKRKKLHWHIDYLTSSRNIEMKRAIYSFADSKNFECGLSHAVAALRFSRVIHSFGSSDCKHGCASHLFMLESNRSEVIHSILQILRKLDLNPITYRTSTSHKDVR